MENVAAYDFLTDSFRHFRARARTMERMGWFIGLGAVAAALLAAPAAIGAAATLTFAGLWCVKIEREDHAVQLVGSGSPPVNL